MELDGCEVVVRRWLDLAGALALVELTGAARPTVAARALASQDALKDPERCPM